MHIRPSGIQTFTLNIGHIVIFVVYQRTRNLVFMKNNFHFYFRKFIRCESMISELSNALSPIKLSFEHTKIHHFFSGEKLQERGLVCFSGKNGRSVNPQI